MVKRSLELDRALLRSKHWKLVQEFVRESMERGGLSHHDEARFLSENRKLVKSRSALNLAYREALKDCFESKRQVATTARTATTAVSGMRKVLARLGFVFS